MSEQDDSYLDLLEEELVELHNEKKDLEAELASLRAQLAAVPVEALKRQYSIVPMGTGDFVLDIIEVDRWLRSLEPQP